MPKEVMKINDNENSEKLDWKRIETVKSELKEIFKVQFSDFCVMVSFQQYTTN